MPPGTTPRAPPIDPAAPLQFVINAGAGRAAADERARTIRDALAEAGRNGELHACNGDELPRVARDATAQALAAGSAVVAVGGDGTINAVAQAAHAAGCAMGVVPQGTFNFFGRSHGIDTDPVVSTRQLLRASVPVPVQVAAVNDRVFLVNASVGLYPDLLEDRETYKARFGRSRWVALGAALATLLRAQRRLSLRIQQEGGGVREVRTLTLFVGNNRLQLEQVGVAPVAPTPGSVTAVVLKPIGTAAMAGLMLRGALGTLGEAESVEHFEFEEMVVQPARLPVRTMKVAFDGEVERMRPPLRFRVLDQPLFLLKPPAATGSDGADQDSEERRR